MLNRITKNYLYNVLYQVFILLMPIIVTPYLSRVLGPDNLGVYSYVFSVTNVISILTLIGIYNYGNRQIAYERNDKQKMSQTFWEIMLLRVLIAVVGSAVYFAVAFYLEKFTVYFLQYYCFLLAAYLDCTWLYVGVEDMRPAVLKNFFAKLVGVICIFIFVKQRADIGNYLLILSISILIANLAAYVELGKYIEPVKINMHNLGRHIKDSIWLFLPTIASLIYLQVDKIMIEWITGQTSQVAFYDNAEKIVMIPLTFITVLSTVMMPRIANEYKQGNKDKINDLIVRAAKTALFLSFPMAFGIAAVAAGFIPWYLGKDFLPVVGALYCLCPIVISNSLEGISGKQYFTATNQISILTIAYTSTALLNVILNFIFIPKFNFYGAAIATLLCSYLSVGIQYFVMERQINLKPLIIPFLKYGLMGIGMFIIVFGCTQHLSPSVFKTLLQLLIGCVCYAGIALLIKDEFFLKILREKSVL